MLATALMKAGSLAKAGVLYDHGEEFVHFEPVLTGSGTRTAEKRSDHLYMSAGNSFGQASAGFMTTAADPIDLTDVIEIDIDWENTGFTNPNNRSELQIVDLVTNSIERNLLRTSSFSRQVQVLDVSDVVGEWRVRVRASDTQTDANAGSLVRAFRIELLT